MHNATAKTILALCLSTLLFSCSNGKREIIHDNLYGVLPCADCAGINIHLALQDSNKYVATVLYDEPGAKPKAYSGQITYLNDSIIALNNPNMGLGNFLIHKGSLVMLDRNNQSIETDLADRYHLHPTPPEHFSLEPQAAFPTSTFKAFGVEPSWSLRIDPDSIVGLRFESMGLPAFSLNTPFVAPKTQVGQFYFEAEVEAGHLKVAITETSCSDTMSDNIYDYKVVVQAKTGLMEDFQRYNGCGFYPQ